MEKERLEKLDSSVLHPGFSLERLAGTVPTDFYAKYEESSVDESVPVTNVDTDSYDPLNPFHTRQSVDIMPFDIINLDNQSDLDNSLMASFANI